MFNQILDKTLVGECDFSVADWQLPKFSTFRTFTKAGSWNELDEWGMSGNGIREERANYKDPERWPGLSGH